MRFNGPLSFALVMLQWILIVATVAASVYLNNPFVYIVAVWFIGSRMVALAEVIGHEAVHNNLFQRKSLNRSLEFLWFLPIFETYDGYQRDHNAHHAHLLQENDPTYHDYKRWGMLEPEINYFWVWFVRPFFFFDTWHLIKTTCQGLVYDAAYRQRILAFWIPAATLIVVTGAGELFFWYWLLPFLWVYPALIFWSEVGEHYKTTEGRTRNTFGFLEWLLISPHNDRYHAVHHRFPRIPWFNLGRAHRALYGNQLGPASESSGFMDLYRQIRKAGVRPV
ncbi:MAG: fatty acid desaturase [bacterium]|nr:fatty acid desaturase [bacterium]